MQTLRVATRCPFCGDPISVRVAPTATKLQAAQAMDGRLSRHMAHHVDEWLEEVFGGP